MGDGADTRAVPAAIMRSAAGCEASAAARGDAKWLDLRGRAAAGRDDTAALRDRVAASNRPSLPLRGEPDTVFAMVRLVLFDIDGTLIQTGGAGVKAFEQVFATEFNVPDATRRLNFAGRTDRSIVREFFHQNGIEPTVENFARAFARYVFWLDHLAGRLSGRVLPGVEHLIEQLMTLPAPPLVGLLTGNIRLGAEIKLRHYQLWDHFAMGAFGDDHEDRNELSGLARERAIRLLNEPLEGGQIVVIGDTPRDIECARKIGAKCLAVATGGSTAEELQHHEPHWVIEDLTHISAKKLCA
jgi:phosphoglycolate phosphatase